MLLICHQGAQLIIWLVAPDYCQGISRSQEYIITHSLLCLHLTSIPYSYRRCGFLPHFTASGFKVLPTFPAPLYLCLYFLISIKNSNHAWILESCVLLFVFEDLYLLFVLYFDRFTIFSRSLCFCLFVFYPYDLSDCDVFGSEIRLFSSSFGLIIDC